MEIDPLEDGTPADKLSMQQLIAQLKATDNDMFYYWDAHKTSAEDVVWRLLNYIDALTERGRTWRSIAQAAYEEDTGLACWNEIEPSYRDHLASDLKANLEQ